MMQNVEIMLRHLDLTSTLYFFFSITIMYFCCIFQDIVDDVEGESESPQFREIQERRQKSALYTSVGSRKNLLELAGTTKNILNTPKKISPAETTLSILIDPSKLQKEFDKSALRPFENSHSLSPSAKYDTPTPPLKTNQFVRNAYRPRRKFSMLREKFEEDSEPAQFRQEKVCLKNFFS